MKKSPLAGKPAEPAMLVNVPKLITAYYVDVPDPSVPEGFKWFVEDLLDSSLGLGGEESAGASFVRRDGRVWTTITKRR